MRWSTLAATLLLAGALSADTIALKDGTLLEGKVVDRKAVRVHGEERVVWVVESESGERREIFEEDVAWRQRMRAPWEARAEALQWYERGKIHVESRWPAQFAFARECARKRLYDQSHAHLAKAYELRKAETPDTAEAREALGDWLLKDCELPGAAADEYRAVYEKRRPGAADARAHFDLGRWCEPRFLYDEAEAQYRRALERDPKFAEATAALTSLQQLRAARFHPGFQRAVAEPFRKALAFLEDKQNPDGSFGKELVEAGVKAHRGVTALVGIALLNRWALDSVARAVAPPDEVGQAIDFICTFSGGPKLRGPDIWGPVFALDFLRLCYKNKYFASRKEKIRGALKSLLDELAAKMGPDGGWMYYDFAKNTSASFVTAAAVVSFVSLKNEKILPVDDALIARAVSQLKRCRLGEANFTYKTGSRLPIEGNAARSPLCELALYITGNGSRDAVQAAVDNFFKYRHIIQKIKGKPGTHIGTGRTAPYYYLFGHYWTTRAIKVLDRETASANLKKMSEAILADQEKDGHFSDWPRYSAHKVCGTALGAMTLFQIMSMENEAPVKVAPK